MQDTTTAVVHFVPGTRHTIIGEKRKWEFGALLIIFLLRGTIPGVKYRTYGKHKHLVHTYFAFLATRYVLITIFGLIHYGPPFIDIYQVAAKKRSIIKSVEYMVATGGDTEEGARL